MSERLPVHPWANDVTDLPEGKGTFYHYGPNYTVDPIVITEEATPSLLLVQRHDTGEWALPGGFIDGEESATVAGRRELQEETGLTLPESLEPVVIYRGPVADHRSTRNAWPETTALLWRIAQAESVTAGDDADVARWVPIDQLPTNLHGSHNLLAEKAIALVTCFGGEVSSSRDTVRQR